MNLLLHLFFLKIIMFDTIISFIQRKIELFYQFEVKSYCFCCTQYHGQKELKDKCCRIHANYSIDHLNDLCPEMSSDLKRVPTCACCGRMIAFPEGTKCTRIHVNSYKQHPDLWCIENGNYYCRQFLRSVRN